MAKTKSGYLGQAAGLIQQGASIENERFKNTKDTPNQYDNNAKLFEDLSNSFGARPGDRPRGAWANIASGFSKGVAHAQRGKSIEKKEEQVSKYDNVMNYLQQASQAAVEQNQWHEKREAAKTEMMPQVLAYMDNIDKLDPQSQRIMAQDMLAQYGEALGENFKLSSIDGSNPFLMTIQSDKGQQLFDLRSMFARDEAMQQSIAMKMPEYQMKLQEERQNKQREFKLKEDKLAMEEKYMPQKYNVQRDRIEQTKRRNDQAGIKSDMKLAETLGKKIDASREFLTIAPKMEQIVKEHPDIFQSAIDAVWRESKEPGYITNMTKDVQNKWNPEKVTALTSMVKYINKMTLDVANGFARPNMFIEKIGSKAVPNLDMNPQGFLNVLGEMVEENKTSVSNNLERFSLLESDVETGVSDQYKRSTANVMEEGGQEAAIPESTVWVKNPETGEQTEIDENQLDAAISAGYEFVQAQNGN